MTKKAFVFIDGGNFYFKLKELTSKLNGRCSLLSFDFKGFSNWLAGDNELIEIRYYIGKLSRKQGDFKSEQMYANQQKLIGKLQQQNIFISFGQIIKHPDGTRHEKGVDVRLAVEMIRFARQDKYDIAYLVSSDTDLVPAVEEVLSFNKKVKYVGSSDMQSFGLTKATGDYLILRPEDIEPFLPKSLI